MKRSLITWAAVAALGLASVPVLAVTVLPSKTNIPTKHVTSDSEKKTTAKSVTHFPEPTDKTPRPAAARLGKTPAKSSVSQKAKPANTIKHKTNQQVKKPTGKSMTHKPQTATHGTKHVDSAKPATLHSEPKNMPQVHSALSKKSTTAKANTLAKKPASSETEASSKKLMTSTIE